MRIILALIFGVFALGAVPLVQAAQETNLTQNVPDTWRKEAFTFPLNFAPEIPYSGIEEAYFSPGMFNPSSDEYFNYVFLWQLDGHEKITRSEYSLLLQQYYEGLYKTVRQIKTSPVFTFKSQIIDNDGGELSFNGSWLDAFNKDRPVTLDLLIYEEFCPATAKTNILFKITSTEHKGAVDTLSKISLPNCQ